MSIINKVTPRRELGVYGQTIFIKWNDDRGRSFENIDDFLDWDEYVEFKYDNPDTGRARIRVYKDEIRWLEFYDAPETEEEEAQNNGNV